MRKLTITLTRRPPVTIDQDLWPIIARSHDFDNQYDFQANRHWRLNVRQHADGRTLVCGNYTSQFQNEPSRREGELLPAPSPQDIVDALYRVGGELEFSLTLIAACVADMPAEVL